jgi:hypothetical protein
MARRVLSNFIFLHNTALDLPVCYDPSLQMHPPGYPWPVSPNTNGISVVCSAIAHCLSGVSCSSVPAKCHFNSVLNGLGLFNVCPQALARHPRTSRGGQTSNKPKPEQPVSSWYVDDGLGGFFGHWRGFVLDCFSVLDPCHQHERRQAPSIGRQVFQSHQPLQRQFGLRASIWN